MYPADKGLAMQNSIKDKAAVTPEKHVNALPTEALNAFHRHYSDMYDSDCSMYFPIILSESTLFPIKYFVTYLAFGSQNPTQRTN